jgi:predicted dehydrogenase
MNRNERSARDMPPVNVGVIGAGGRMGQLHAQTYATLAGARLVAVCDVDEAAAGAVADRFGAAAYRDYEAMLAQPDLEAVSICTPDPLHVGPAIAAARAGKHVLLEKPIATTRDDARAIARAYAAAGVVLLVGHVLRFDPRFVAAKQALDAGELGALQTLFARRANNVGGQDRLQGRVSLPMFLGVHDYDLLRWYAGSEVTEVVARSREILLRAAGYDVEDATTAIFTFANGVMATSELSWILPRSFGPSGDHRMELTGDAGCFKIDSLHSGVAKSTAAGNVWLDPFTSPLVAGVQAGSFANELGHFLRAARGLEPPALTPEDAIAALEMALAVTEAAATGQAIRMEPSSAVTDR